MPNTTVPANPQTNPIINNPYLPTQWHWELDSNVKAVDPAMPGRRPSQNIPPVVGEGVTTAKQKAMANRIGGDWPHLELVNAVRAAAERWAENGYPGATETTRNLLRHWETTAQEQPEYALYYAQRDALLAHIYLTECPPDYGERRKISILQQAAEKEYDNETGGAPRICHKMATGAGKTAVIAAIILYHVCNHASNPADPRFGNRFLIIAPNTTVRDRLLCLKPAPDNGNDEYRERSLLPYPETNFHQLLRQAEINIANWQSITPRNPGPTYAKNVNDLLGKDLNQETRETDLEAAKRAAGIKDETNPGKVIIINDEAHHAHNRAGNRNRESTLWLNAISALAHAGLVRGYVTDLTATPILPSSKKNQELMPWIVSDCGLIEAQEAGLTKIPRAPVSRDSDTSKKYRNLYETTPKQDRSRFAAGDNANCADLKQALDLIAKDYVDSVPQWQETHHNDPGSPLLPALAVVMNSTNNANEMYRHLAEGNADAGNIPGESENAFRNYRTLAEGKREWLPGPPRTILVHSEIMDDGKDVPKGLKTVIHELAQRYLAAYPSLNHGETDSEIIRKVMNSVGKPGEPGEHVRCIISVNMLSEGWDARNVTHLLGFRAFGSALLCEQVAGRTLRRSVMDYNPDSGRYSPEYATVIGIPFRENENDGRSRENDPNQFPILTVATPPERNHYEIHWPNIEKLEQPDAADIVRAYAADPVTKIFQVPNYRENVVPAEGIIGNEQNITDAGANSRQRYLYETAAIVAERISQELSQDDAAPNAVRKGILFSDLLNALRQHLNQGNVIAPAENGAWPTDNAVNGSAEWLRENVSLTYPTQRSRTPLTPVKNEQPWLTSELAREYAVRHNPDLVYANCGKSHANHAKCDSSWETRTAQALDANPDIVRWVRNNRLGWKIPYQHQHEAHAYLPDFVAVANLPDGKELHLVIEVKGRESDLDGAKKEWTENHWIPAVNADPEYGQDRIWKYLYLDAKGMAAGPETVIAAAIANAITEMKSPQSMER